MLEYATLDDRDLETIEFPNEDGIRGAEKNAETFSFEYEPLKENSLVKVTSWGSSFEVHCSVEIYLGKIIEHSPFLGELKVSSHSALFKKLLDKYGRRWRGSTSKNKLWEIEFGILRAAYQCFKRNPQELEQILKVAKTKKDLKIHLGVS